LDKLVEAGKQLVEKIGNGSLKQRIDTLLKDAVDNGSVPGVVAMVCNSKEVLYEGAFGERGLCQGGVMTTDSVFWIASMTKALTGIAAMQLFEKNKIDLDSPASYWLPSLALVKVLEGFNRQGQPIIRAPKRSVTLRHLLTHTSGFGYKFMSRDILRYQEVTGTLGMTGFKNATLMTPLLFDPGAKWNYGISMDWAAKLVENVSGLEFGVYLRENVFQPLEMMTTAFRCTPEMKAKKTKFHTRDASGKLTVQEADQTPQDYEFESGGGGLWSTAGDYLAGVYMTQILPFVDVKSLPLFYAFEESTYKSL